MRTLRDRQVLDYSGLSATPTNVMVPVLYKKMLRFLSNKTRVRQGDFIREAFRDLLIKHRQEFKNSEFDF